MDIAALAVGLVTSVLVPLFKKTADGVTSDLQQRAGDAIADKAQGLWSKIKGKLGGSTTKAAIATSFEEEPELVQDTVRRIVEEVLANDPALAAEADDLASDAGGDRTTWNINAHEANVADFRHAQIHGGQAAAVIKNYGTTAAQPSDPSSA